MTAEPSARTHEPLERRVVAGAGAVLSLVFWLVLIWDQLETDGPREWLAAQREKLAERRRYFAAMRSTLDEIDDLPELDDELELEPDETPAAE